MYAGDATRKASDRFRGTFKSDGDISLEVGEEYWINGIGIGRNISEDFRSTIWVTTSTKQESISEGWDIGEKITHF